jgi:hypothetical protein
MKQPKYVIKLVNPRPIPAILVAIYRGMLLRPCPTLERIHGHA